MGPSWSDLVRAGILGGIFGGVLMGLSAMVRSAVVGLGIWLPAKLVAGLALGVETLLGDGGAVLLGTLIHFVTASAWGIPFAFIATGRVRGGGVLFLGLVYGAIVWALMTYLVLPWANPTLSDRLAFGAGWFFFDHLVYGATLALVPWMARAPVVSRSEGPA